MDAVAGLLDGPRARGAFLLRTVMEPPWALRVQDEAPLTIVAVVRGEAHIAHDDADPVRLGPSDVAVVRGPAPYTVAGDLVTPPLAIIHPGQVCETPAGESLEQSLHLGVRTWGNALDGATELLTGSYTVEGDVSRRLLDALPPVLVLRDDECDCPYIGLLRAEMAKEQDGQEAVLDRLLDLLLIAVLREWFDRPEARAPGWYRAQADPVVGHALRLLHHHPGEPWTVASLARECGVSRAVLARRFTELVGEPPMTFLTGWRIALAADLLLEPGATIGAVAHHVGYATPFALSAAFKRVRGVSPQQHRAAMAAAA